MSEVRISAEARTEFGKGAARRIRRDHRVPAVLYGHGNEPRHISLPGHELMLALKTANALFQISFTDGDDQLALPKDIQRDPVRGTLEHVDLIVVTKGEKVKVDVPLHVVGHAGPDTLVVSELIVLEVLTEATHIPQFFEVSIEGRPAGTQILAKDIPLPAGTELAGDPDALVVNITGQISEEQLESELAEAEADAGIERDESEAEAAAAPEAAADAAPAEAAE
ncbi:MAG TPA: 50S ribosomal protein L25/general stress protein Ctc [Sporichthyaceae bacterium]